MAKWSQQALEDLARIRKSGSLQPEKVQALERDTDAWAAGLASGQRSTREFNLPEISGGHLSVTAVAEPVSGAVQIASLVVAKRSADIGVNVSFSPSAIEDLEILKRIHYTLRLEAEMLEKEVPDWVRAEARNWPDGSLQVSGRLGLDKSIANWRAVAWRYGVDVQVNVQVVRIYFHFH